MTYAPWCDGKTPYPSKGAAMARIRHQKDNRYRKRAESSRGQQLHLMPYRCTECHQWHVGAASRDMKVNKFGQPDRRGSRHGNTK
jgi:hypothetical protein